jgi:hypothetical protein
LFHPNNLSFVLNLLVLFLQKRQLLQPQGPLEMIHFLLLRLQTNLQLFLLLLKLFHLLGHNFISIQLLNLLSVHLVQNLLTNIGTSKLSKLILSMLHLNILNLLLLSPLIPLLSLLLQP